MICIDCSFPFGNGGSGVLANCLFCGNKANLSVSAGPVCSGFSAEACSILHALGWFRQHQQICHLSFLFLFILATRALLPFSFYLKLWQELFSLSFFTMRLQWVPGHSFFFQGATWLMMWPNGEHYSCSVQFLVPCASLLILLVSTVYHFSDWSVLSYLNSLTHRLP